jgi:hypothetical protein
MGSASNYSITYVSGTLTVNPRPLTITASNISKPYGLGIVFFLPAFTVGATTTTPPAGLVNGDAIFGISEASDGGLATATVTSPGPNYALIPSNAGFFGGAAVAGNYSITYVNGTLTVDPALLAITATNQSKTYGTAVTPAGTEFMITGQLFNSDTVTSVTLSSNGYAATATVTTPGSLLNPPYLITPSAAAGTGVGNYTISYFPGTMQVNQKALTITAANQSKTYGTALTPAGTEFTTGAGQLVNSDTVSSVTLSSSGYAATATVTAPGPTYPITPSAPVFSLGSAGNYNITYVPGTLTVNPRPLTITAPNSSKLYGEPIVLLAFNFGGFSVGATTTSPPTGLVNGDLVYGATLTSAGADATATVTSPGPNYPVDISGATFTNLSGGPGMAANYNITYVPGTLTVNPRPLTITASNQSKTYGMAVTPAGTEFTTGPGQLFNSDTVTSVTLGSNGYAATATVTTPGPNYSITPSAAAGTGLGNYTITYVNGTLTVNAAPLSATTINFSATAGGPFIGAVATFTSNPDTIDSATAFTALIHWGDGSTSTGVITGSNGSFTVSGKHTFADPNAYAVSVQISNPNTTPNPATVNDTATVTNLNQGVVKGLIGGPGFWNGKSGQALIQSFGSTATGLTLANWLAMTFPNLYGSSTGTNNLTNQNNAQVATYFQTLFSQSAKATGTKTEVLAAQAAVDWLATALSVYATTTSLGGNAGAAGDGFSVSATGLGADSFNVGSDGAAFGVANNTTRNVYELLLAVNQQAVNGVLDNGNTTLQAEAADLFNLLSKAGNIG